MPLRDTPATIICHVEGNAEEASVILANLHLGIS